MGYTGGLLRKTLPHTVVWLMCVIMCENVSYLLTFWRRNYFFKF